MYSAVTIVLLILPFITLGENNGHIFLLSFDHKQLHIFGIVFDMQEFYLMPFFLILLFLGIFFMTTLAGRVFCGWACPQTIFRVIFRDLIETKILKLRKRIDNKQQNPDLSLFLNQIKKAIALGIWFCLSLLIASNFMWYFVPPQDFFTYLFQEPLADHTILLTFLACITAAIFFEVSLIGEKFCAYMCPYCRVQSVLYDKDTIMTVYDYKRGGEVYNSSGVKMWKKPETPQAECTGCEACVKVCPTHIDIRKGLQLECINCLECADACVKVMGKLGKVSLIGWTSMDMVETRNKVNYFRFRTTGYLIVLAIVFVSLLIMGSKKENMLLNINTFSERYSIKSDGSVDNSYSFLFQNTSPVPHTYYFEVDHADIYIKRPKKGILLQPGEKSKMIVTLSTKENLSTAENKDTAILLNIHAFAEDDPTISIQREIIFTYPYIKK
uniref:cytochrome c oxidase accessory protein CcoG n=1 Tax=Helicobacter sp. 15-1451 TaxID=2004995 RepID=UPI00215D5335|nr:cytochrome c oxidase accessory protein CcoG [Helicobacter sp. 15-1451]